MKKFDLLRNQMLEPSSLIWILFFFRAAGVEYTTGLNLDRIVAVRVLMHNECVCVCVPMFRPWNIAKWNLKDRKQLTESELPIWKSTFHSNWSNSGIVCPKSCKSLPAFFVQVTHTRTKVSSCRQFAVHRSHSKQYCEVLHLYFTMVINLYVSFLGFGLFSVRVYVFLWLHTRQWLYTFFLFFVMLCVPLARRIWSSYFWMLLCPSNWTGQLKFAVIRRPYQFEKQIWKL